MDLEKRVGRLESLIGIIKEDPPLLFIKTVNCEKNSTDPRVLDFGVIPGKIRGTKGQFLTRHTGEDQDSFLSRCSAAYSQVYN